MTLATPAILERVVQFIADGESSVGTAFVVDAGEVQLLVTARHLVTTAAVGEATKVHVGRGGGLTTVGATRLPLAGSGDVAVLALHDRVVTAQPIVIDPHYHQGAEALFVGYPGDVSTDYSDVVRTPMVRRALVGAHGQAPDGTVRLYLDGHNVAGFSGGPVIAAGTDGAPAVIGVVSAARTGRLPVTTKAGGATPMEVLENLGMVVATGVDQVAELLASFNKRAAAARRRDANRRR